ncbi:MAG: hypothetical protein ABF243_10975, partial [Celeribacter marinus]
PKEVASSGNSVPRLDPRANFLGCKLYGRLVFTLRRDTEFLAVAEISSLRARAAQKSNSQYGLKPTFAATQHARSTPPPKHKKTAPPFSGRAVF